MARAAKATDAAKGKTVAAKPAPETAAKPVTKVTAAKAKGAAGKPAEPPAKLAKAKVAPKVAAKAKGGAKAAEPAKPTKPASVSLRQLALGVADSQGASGSEAHVFATKLIESVVEHVKAGRRVKITGLGVIEIRERAARTARNPATGEPVQVAASRKLVFRPERELKEAV